jgi:hypothetical protein
MTSAGSRSDQDRKVESSSPETSPSFPSLAQNDGTYDPTADAYRSWLLAIDAMHELVIADLVSDHEDRMPQGWLWDFQSQMP